MTDEHSEIADASRGAPAEPKLQFGLRDIFVVTTILAIYLTAFVSIFRAWPTAAFRSGFLGIILPGLYFAGQRFASARRAQRDAGNVLLTLNRVQSEWWRRLNVWGLPAAVVFLIAITKLLRPWYSASAPPEYSPAATALSTALTFLTLFNFLIALEVIGSRSLRICEHGLVIGADKFVPWPKLSPGASILDENGTLVVRRYRFDLGHFDAYVPPEQRALVEHLLGKKLAPRR